MEELKSTGQKWIFQGRVLRDEQTLVGEGIQTDLVVHVIKTAAPTADEGVSRVAPAHAYVPVPAFDRSMSELLSNEESKAKEAVILLLKIISNIIEHPMEEKYRKILCSSKAFFNKVGSLRGGSACMEALGFTVVGEHWVLTPTASAWEVLIASQAKLDRFMARYIEVQRQPDSDLTQANTAISTPPSDLPGGGTTTSLGRAQAGDSSNAQVQGQDEALNQAMQLMLRTMMNATATSSDAESGDGKSSGSADATSETTEDSSGLDKRSNVPDK